MVLSKRLVLLLLPTVLLTTVLLPNVSQLCEFVEQQPDFLELRLVGSLEQKARMSAHGASHVFLVLLAHFQEIDCTGHAEVMPARNGHSFCLGNRFFVTDGTIEVARFRFRKNM